MRALALLILIFAGGTALAQDRPPQNDRRANTPGSAFQRPPRDPFYCDSVLANDCFDMFYRRSCQGLTEAIERRDCVLTRTGTPDRAEPR